MKMRSPDIPNEGGIGPGPLADPRAALEEQLVDGFLASPRWRPERPAHFDESIVILRGSVVPHYHAVFDHVQGRYTELRYPLPNDQGWRSVALPADRAPMLMDRRQQPHIRPRGDHRKHHERGPVDAIGTPGKGMGGTDDTGGAIPPTEE